LVVGVPHDTSHEGVGDSRTDTKVYVRPEREGGSKRWREGVRKEGGEKEGMIEGGKEGEREERRRDEREGD